MSNTVLYIAVGVGALLLFNKMKNKQDAPKPSGGGGSGTGAAGSSNPGNVNFGIPGLLDMINNSTHGKGNTNFPNSLGHVIRGIKPTFTTAGK